MSSKTKPHKRFSYAFKNNRGERVFLKSDLTMRQLVEMGVQDIRLLSPKEPIPDNWWRCEV